MGNLQNVTKETFQQEVLEYDGIAVVDFWAPWCGPCRAFEPVLERIQARFAKDGVKVIKVQADKEADLAAQYGVRSIPALLIFKGGKTINVSTGMQSEDLVASRITPYLAKAGE